MFKSQFFQALGSLTPQVVTFLTPQQNKINSLRPGLVHYDN